MRAILLIKKGVVCRSCGQFRNKFIRCRTCKKLVCTKCAGSDELCIDHYITAHSQDFTDEYARKQDAPGTTRKEGNHMKAYAAITMMLLLLASPVIADTCTLMDWYTDMGSDGSLFTLVDTDLIAWPFNATTDLTNNKIVLEVNVSGKVGDISGNTMNFTIMGNTGDDSPDNTSIASNYTLTGSDFPASGKFNISFGSVTLSGSNYYHFVANDPDETPGNGLQLVRDNSGTYGSSTLDYKTRRGDTYWTDDGGNQDTWFRVWYCLPPGNNPPNATLILPASNATINQPYNITFNGSDVDGNGINTSLVLFQAGSEVSTIKTGMNASNSSFYWAAKESSGKYNLTLKVCETATSELYCTNSTNEFFLDNDAPSATFTYPSGDNSTMAENGTFVFNWTFSDNNMIYSINVSCDNYNDFQQNLDAATVNYSNATSFAGVGIEMCNVTWCDAHTAAGIGNWQVSKTSNSVTFESLTLATPQLLNDITWNKKHDRYSFCFDMANSKDEYLYISLPKGCYHVPYSPYNAHFVCFNKYWVDFEGWNTTVFGRTVKVGVADRKTSEVCFNSVGSLNCNTTSLQFSLYYDNVAPLVYNGSPTNLTILQVSEVPESIVFSAQNNETSNCSLIINGELNSSINNTLGKIEYPSLELMYGNLTWTVNCTDANGNVGTLGTMSLNITYLTTSLNYTSLAGDVPESWSRELDVTTTPGMLMLFFYLLLCFLILLIGILTGLPVFVVFAGIMFLVLGFVISFNASLAFGSMTIFFGLLIVMFGALGGGD